MYSFFFNYYNRFENCNLHAYNILFKIEICDMKYYKKNFQKIDILALEKKKGNYF